MSQVNVTIAGRSYRMGCDEGQEHALVALAEDLDRRIATFRDQFGEIGDMRLLIMVALALSDELGELRGRMKGLEHRVGEVEGERDSALSRIEGVDHHYSRLLDEAAERVERLTKALSSGHVEG